MPFFQNPLAADFIGVWVLGDRQYSIDFKCPRNTGRGDEFVVTHAEGPYDLSGNDADGDSKAVLTVSFALNNFKNWADLAISVAGSTPAATTADEIVTLLNANATFNSFLVAAVHNYSNGRRGLTIKQNKPATNFRFYIKKGRAETVLNFNKFAGIAELPTFFDRHTIENRFEFTNSENAIIALDPGTLDVDVDLINNAVDANGTRKGFSAATVQADYELLRGRSGIFTFQKNTVDSSSRITETIEYPAGAIVGDMARKITFTFTGAKTQPDKRVEVPYVLQSGDLVTP